MNAFVYPSNIMHFGSSVDRIECLIAGERIAAPAIRLDDMRVFYVEPIKHPTPSDPPTSYKRVESSALLSGHVGDFYRDQYGFVTTAGRFVRPKHAARIASVAGQLFRPFKEPSIGLTPADLW